MIAQLVSVITIALIVNNPHYSSWDVLISPELVNVFNYCRRTTRTTVVLTYGSYCCSYLRSYLLQPNGCSYLLPLPPWRCPLYFVLNKKKERKVEEKKGGMVSIYGTEAKSNSHNNACASPL